MKNNYQSRNYWESLYPSISKFSKKTKEFVLHQREQRFALIRTILTSKIGISILEAGCGTADDLANFAVADTLCVGLDYSRNALRTAKARNSSINLVLGDISMLPFVSNKFDLVFNAGVLEHFQDSIIPLGEMNRVSKNSGLVITFVPNTLSFWTLYRHITNNLNKMSKKFHGWPVWEKSFDKFSLKSIGEKSGLIDIRIKGITLLHYAHFIIQCEQTLKIDLLPSSIKNVLFDLFCKLDQNDSELSKWFGMELVLIGRSSNCKLTK